MYIYNVSYIIFYIYIYCTVYYIDLDVTRRDALEAEKSKSRKNSPTTTVAPKIGFDTSGGIVRGQNNVTESRQLQHTGSRLSLQTNSTTNGSSRSIPSMCKQSSVDSASSACLEQINTMNLASLQVSDMIIEHDLIERTQDDHLIPPSLCIISK